MVRKSGNPEWRAGNRAGLLLAARGRDSAGGTTVGAPLVGARDEGPDRAATRAAPTIAAFVLGLDIQWYVRSFAGPHRCRCTRNSPALVAFIGVYNEPPC